MLTQNFEVTSAESRNLKTQLASWKMTKSTVKGNFCHFNFWHCRLSASYTVHVRGFDVKLMLLLLKWCYCRKRNAAVGLLNRLSEEKEVRDEFVLSAEDILNFMAQIPQDSAEVKSWVDEETKLQVCAFVMCVCLNVSSKRKDYF